MRPLTNASINQRKCQLPAATSRCLKTAPKSRDINDVLFD